LIDGYTVTMPAIPVDGQIVGFSFTHGVTTLTHAANAGPTLNNGLTAAAAGQAAAWIYRARNTTWYRYR
jgi:hypothetical protein